MKSISADKLITIQEYLQLEEKSPVRHEFIDGKLHEVPDEHMLHEKMIMNLISILFHCNGIHVFSHGLRVRSPKTENYYYPDIVITAEIVEKIFHIQAPLFIAEILSPSTRVFNLVDKFIAYRRFTSLHYYLLAEPDFCQVTLFYKSESGDWESEVFHQLTATISLEKLGVQLPVAEIYSGMAWAVK